MSIGDRPAQCRPKLALGLLHVGLTRNVNKDDIAVIIPPGAPGQLIPDQSVLYTHTAMGKLRHEPEYVAWMNSYDAEGIFKGPPAEGRALLAQQMHMKRQRTNSERRDAEL